ncbi:kinase-like domain-containing protein [Xylariomycetidae sp. FL2044]|nr:kinase-like domain-containing protein [Xylariomycetidae sp. FL2044]
MAMEVAGLAIGVVGVIPVCIKFNDYVRELVHNLRHSKTQKLFKYHEIESHLQIISLHKSAVAKLDEEQQNILEFKITELHESMSELQDALKKFDNEPPRVIGSAIWAFRAKKKIQELLDRISKERFGLTLQLLLINSFFRSPNEKDSPSDTERILDYITKSLALRGSAPPATEPEAQQPAITEGLRAIPGSDLYLKKSSSRMSFWVVEDLPFVGTHDRDRTVSRIRQVSRVFHGDTYDDRGDQMKIANIGQYVGYAVLARSAQLVMEIPSESESLRSLRELLTMRKNHSLNARLGLAKALARAVFFTHAYRYVHKDLRPGNILVETVDDTSRPHEFGQVLLAGFGDARAEAENKSSLRKGTSVDDINIYRHPSRVKDIESYTFLHDVYSLGVCLLELGLWANFLGEKHAEMRRASPVERQRRLRSLAEKHLPKEMGVMYANVVKKCLNGIDYGFDNAGTSPVGDVALGRRYCESVLEEFERINL